MVNRMPFFATLVLLIAAGTAAVPSQPATRPKIGQPAPPFALLDQNRKRVSLAEGAGAKVVLIFYRGYW